MPCINLPFGDRAIYFDHGGNLLPISNPELPYDQNQSDQMTHSGAVWATNTQTQPKKKGHHKWPKPQGFTWGIRRKEVNVVFWWSNNQWRIHEIEFLLSVQLSTIPQFKEKNHP